MVDILKYDGSNINCAQLCSVRGGWNPVYYKTRYSNEIRLYDHEISATKMRSDYEDH